MLLELDADAADEVRRAFNAAEAIVDFRGIPQIIHEYHGLGPVRAHIVTERRPLPEDLMESGVLGVKAALPVAQSGDERSTEILAQNVPIWPAGLVEGVLNYVREALA